MKKIIVLLAVATASLRCMYMQEAADRARFGNNPYAQSPFYTRYLNSSNPADQQILLLIDILRENQRNAAAHNELGSLLASKGFPNDAEREFLRAIAADGDFYPAWYNLALIKEGQGEVGGAIKALRQTLDLKRGHAEAHFQLGVIYEEMGKNRDAIHHYAQAIRFNRAVLDLKRNPRLVDAKLIDLALLELYPTEHARRILRPQSAPPDYVPPGAMPEPQRAPSEQPTATEIVTPSQPVTEPSQQPAPPNPNP
jgi:tetratricopeptide (TPR) repeat protein